MFNNFVKSLIKSFKYFTYININNSIIIRLKNKF